jgi:hypothetical protein
MSAAILDTAALIGFERNDRPVVAIVARALDHHDALLVPAGVVAQALAGRRPPDQACATARITVQRSARSRRPERSSSRTALRCIPHQ